MHGDQDTLYSEEEVENWDKFADNVEYIAFDGDHYFINDSFEDYIDEIKDALEL